MSETEDNKVVTKNPAELTFRDTEEMARFVTDTGKILPRKYTGLTSSQQRHISRVIKQSRSMLLMK